MFGSEILEIAVGLLLVYLLLSLIVTAITELTNRMRALRAKNFDRGIENLLGDLSDAGLTARDFFATPMMRSMTSPRTPRAARRAERVAREAAEQGRDAFRLRDWLHLAGEHRPGYISGRTFYESLLQLFGARVHGYADAEAFVRALPEGSDLRRNLEGILLTAEGSLEEFREGVIAWFDDAMDRVSGWFKRQAHTTTLVVSFGVAVVFNASTIHVAEVLWIDDVRREAILVVAREAVDDSRGDGAALSGGAALEMVRAHASLPLGWRHENPFHRDKPHPVTREPIPGWGPGRYFSQALGWVLTGFALSLGAPFWFDLLQRVINLRVAGAAPDDRSSARSGGGAPPSSPRQNR